MLWKFGVITVASAIIFQLVVHFYLHEVSIYLFRFFCFKDKEEEDIFLTLVKEIGPASRRTIHVKDSTILFERDAETLVTTLNVSNRIDFFRYSMHSHALIDSFKGD
jgi:hypothetical protein